MNRMYTCHLAGCKSAWGSSEDLFHHLKNDKHQKNFLKYKFPEEPRIANFNKSEVFAKLMELQMQNEVCVDDMKKVCGDDKFYELYNRDPSWSEKKAKLGGVFNANEVPLGQARRGQKRKADYGFGDRNSSLFEEFTITPEMSQRSSKTVFFRLEKELDIVRREGSMSEEMQRKIYELSLMRLGLVGQRLHEMLPGFPKFDQLLDSQMRKATVIETTPMAKLKNALAILEVKIGMNQAKDHEVGDLASEFQKMSMTSSGKDNDELEQISDRIQALALSLTKRDENCNESKKKETPPLSKRLTKEPKKSAQIAFENKLYDFVKEIIKEESRLSRTEVRSLAEKITARISE